MVKPRGGARPNSGPPPKELNWDIIEEAACSLHNKTKIARDLKCHVDTLDSAIRREQKIEPSEFFAQKKEIACSRILAKQLEVALAGNVTMLIWLGKVLLGQSDRSQIEHSVNMATTLDLSRLSVDKLKQMNALLKEASQKD